MTSRPCEGEADLQGMLEFLSSATSVAPAGAYWHPGDVIWGMYQNTVFDPRREVRLWEVGDDLLGFAWLEEPDGTFGSYCICWFDEGSRTGMFEPVGTRPTRRGKGLGTTVMLEGQHRLRDLGARAAAITAIHDNEAAIGLYESVGFKTVNREHLYGKKL